MIVPVPSFPPVIGESGGDRIVRIIRAYDGCSLSSRTADLGALVARGVDEPADVVRITTNCAMFALGVLKAAGCQHRLLDRPWQTGVVFAWIVQIGNDMNAWKPPTAGLPPVGSALWYRIPGTNDDHVEFYMSAPDEHGGGGRPNNAITVGYGDIHSSWSRPLWRYLDPDCLGLPDAFAATLNGDKNGNG
jgi:hypothetical protein